MVEMTSIAEGEVEISGERWQTAVEFFAAFFVMKAHDPRADEMIVDQLELRQLFMLSGLYRTSLCSTLPRANLYRSFDLWGDHFQQALDLASGLLLNESRKFMLVDQLFPYILFK